MCARSKLEGIERREEKRSRRLKRTMKKMRRREKKREGGKTATVVHCPQSLLANLRETKIAQAS